ncbi:alanine--tRNA ligase, partial [bacterium]
DFSHYEAVSPAQLREIEALVNAGIRANAEGETRIMSYDDAVASGAMALFGEKYGDRVRVLRFGDLSTELCGGTHVDRTGEIGLFKIVSESSVAAGVRRIEAITGAGALRYLRDLEDKWNGLARRLKAAPDEIPERIERQAELLKKYERELSQLKAKLASGGGGGEGDLMQQVREVGGVKVLALRRDIDDLKSLRDFSDQVKNKLGSGVSVIGSAVEGKATLIVRVSKDLTGRFDAGKLAKELAAMVGGSGGGKAEMAQAGGPNLDGLDGALSKVYDLVQG